MNEGDVYNIVVVYKDSYTVTPRCNVTCGDGGGAEDLQNGGHSDNASVVRNKSPTY